MLDESEARITERTSPHFAQALRPHLCHGERLLRTGRRADAPQALRLAIDGFEELGAAPWAGRAHTELRATGATPRRRSPDANRDRLTAHELQARRGWLDEGPPPAEPEQH